MRFYVLTLFPEMIRDGLDHSIIKRGKDNGLIEIIPIDIRDLQITSTDRSMIIHTAAVRVW